MSDRHAGDPRPPWYERLGVQINHPPPEVPETGPAEPGYERPPIWRRNVAPFRVVFLSQVSVFAIVLAVLTVVGVDEDLVFLPSYLVGVVANYGAESWWRRNRPPSADAPPRRLFARRRA